MSNSKLEQDFETVKKEVTDKMIAARKLIEEADELARNKLHVTLHGADEDAFEDLQGVMEDAGFVTEREVSWDSSGCSF